MDLCILVSVSELLHNLSISKYRCGIKLYIDKISVEFNFFFLIHVLVVLPGTMPVPLEDCSSLSAPHSHLTTFLCGKTLVPLSVNVVTNRIRNRFACDMGVHDQDADVKKIVMCNGL